MMHFVYSDLLLGNQRRISSTYTRGRNTTVFCIVMPTLRAAILRGN